MQSFTSVVGPNGSGKSNVIDAMLFVFGKRAKQVCCTKTCLQHPHGVLLLRQLVWTEMLILSGLQLRLNKVSELIHNSTNHKNLAMARVCVHFQEILDTVSLTQCLCCDALMLTSMQTPQKDCVRPTVEDKLLQGDETFEVIPESHFTVSRTAHRNNSSDYYIDEKKSNFTEVTKLLKSKGIDLDNNRFLILQVSCLSNLAQSHCIHDSFIATPASAVYLFSSLSFPAVVVLCCTSVVSLLSIAQC